jgi:hypothetical protein
MAAKRRAGCGMVRWLLRCACRGCQRARGVCSSVVENAEMEILDEPLWRQRIAAQLSLGAGFHCGRGYITTTPRGVKNFPTLVSSTWVSNFRIRLLEPRCLF